MNSSTGLTKGTTIIINNNININTYVTKQYYYDNYNRPDSTSNKLYDKYLPKEEKRLSSNQVYNADKKKNKYSNDNLFGSSTGEYKPEYRPYDRSRQFEVKNLSSYHHNSDRKLPSSSNNIGYKYDSYTSLYKKYQNSNNQGLNNLY
jgi:hypothetical protein